MSDIQTIYQETITFAAQRHREQKVKGTDLPYLVHLCNVAMEVFMAASHTDEFDLAFAVRVSLLHDVIEATSTTFDEISERYGQDIADAVLSLTKDDKLPKALQTAGSLSRIKKLRKEVWAVKLADRIANLQPPPDNWDKEKRTAYRKDAILIWEALKDGNNYLAERLHNKIDEYDKFLEI